MEDHMAEVRRGCEHAYLDDLNHDNLAIIRVQRASFRTSPRQHQSYNPSGCSIGLSCRDLSSSNSLPPTYSLHFRHCLSTVFY